MFYLDNSETSWLVYADWLEDQNIDATHIREGVINSTSNQWCWEYKIIFGVGGYGRDVGYRGKVGIDNGVGGGIEVVGGS